MKKIISIIIICICINNNSNAQALMSTYNLSKNDENSLRMYEEEYMHQNYPNKEKKKNRFVKTMMYSGILVGGLLLGEQASHHDYYMSNTMIYGVGGVMTILATGLVLTSVNGINKNLFVSIKKEGLTMCLAIK